MKNEEQQERRRRRSLSRPPSDVVLRDDAARSWVYFVETAHAVGLWSRNSWWNTAVFRWWIMFWVGVGPGAQRWSQRRVTATPAVAKSVALICCTEGPTNPKAWVELQSWRRVHLTRLFLSSSPQDECSYRVFFNQTFSNLTLCLDFNFNMNYFGFEPRMFLFTDAPKWKSPEGARQENWRKDKAPEPKWVWPRAPDLNEVESSCLCLLCGWTSGTSRT